MQNDSFYDNNNTPKISRTDTSKERTIKFLKSSGSGFVYLRGRRRIGKSTLLKELELENKNVFYFTGVLDEPEAKTYKRFVEKWSLFTNTKSLSDLKLQSVSWGKIFDAIRTQGQSKQVCILFDEIQWLAKGRSGFIGLLKAAWLDWESTGRIKVVVCGSSNKFFHKYSGGEEQILRGQRTHADIWLAPVGLGQIKKDLHLDWTNDELIFASFYLSGIPYYWKHIQTEKPFLKSLNEVVFTNRSIFLNEVDELLRIEFNQSGVTTVKKVLLAIGVLGATENTIKEKTRLAQSSVNETLSKLLDYSLVYEKLTFKNSSIKKGQQFYLKEPLLLAYASQLYQLRGVLKSATEESFLIKNFLEGKSNLYIPNFTGTSFENMMQIFFEVPEFKTNLLDIVDLNNSSFSVHRPQHSNSHQASQIDLLLNECNDRVVRLVECKWTKNSNLIKDQILTFGTRANAFKDLYAIKENHQCILITNCPVGREISQLAKQSKVAIVSTEELF